MAPSRTPEEFYTHKGRLASFAPSKRRASTAKGKATKTIKWPHSFLSADQLATAGFYYDPTVEMTDNVTCFLCCKSILGWEEGDNPLVEHRNLSPDCGWAIVASIEARDEALLKEYPLSEAMIQARKATFADRWPHDEKKGWKCKSKQLVESGWIYKPTPESDDMAICAYCDLGLDGWEPADDPLDQHYKRNPECTFFTLINNSPEKTPKKKAAKGRKPRASKASRLSTQSSFTIASEAPSFDDVPAEEGDSVLTTATTATISQGGKKMPKAAKKTAGRKTKAKKDEAVEVVAPEPEDDDFEVKIDLKPKTAKGRKRNSEEMEGVSVPEVVLAPPAKRRATRTRGSMAMADSVLGNSTIVPEPADDMEDSVGATASAPRKRGRPSKVSRNFSTASKASLRANIPDDDEIDSALQADLDRPLTDDEEMNEAQIAVPKRGRASQGGRGASVASMRKTSRSSKITKADHAMFGTEQMDIDDAAIEAELEAMQAEESKPLPKAKGAKGKQPRKVSAKQQAAAKRAAEAAEAEAQVQAELEASISKHEESNIVESIREPSPEPQPKAKRGGSRAPSRKAAKGTRGSALSVAESNVSIPSEADGAHDDSGNETDASMASQSTVVRGGGSRRGSTLKKSKTGKKAVARNIEEIVRRPLPTPPTQPEVEEQPSKQPKITRKPLPIEVSEVTEDIITVEIPAEAPAPKATKAKPTKGKGKAKVTVEVFESVEQEPAPAARSPTPPPKEATPSPSPQSSDAENRPPSSKPSTIKNTQTTSQIPLAASTPTMSPSKRNIIAGLQSTQPWSSLDLDELLLKSPNIDKENAGAASKIFGVALLNDAVDKAKRGQLTSPEKGMTVEEWIRFNAGLAEEKLRGECERLVGVFESQGTRAMRALEGIECVE